ncbi:MAG: hypothetical protein IKH32_00900 [Prevotella sp.]|nr:hypothetical protein [Prevotella sp.]
MTINGQTFYEMPTMCGTCPFFLAGREDTMGFCTCFNKHKSRWANVPKRCKELFEKCFQIGGDLVIVIKE